MNTSSDKATDSTATRDALRARLKKAEEQLYAGALDKAIAMAEEVDGDAVESGEELMRVIAFSIIGRALFGKGELGRARDLFTQGAAIAREQNREDMVASSLNNAGRACQKLGDLDRALELHREALSIRQEVGDEEGVCTSLMNIGFVHGDRRDYPEALDMFQQVESLAREHGQHDIHRSVLINIATVYEMFGEYGEAAGYIQRSLEIPDSQTKQDEVELTARLATLYAEMGRTEDAIAIATEALENSDAASFENIRAYILGCRSQAYVENNELEKALEDLDEAIEIEERLGNEKELRPLRGNKGSVLHLLGRVEEAYQILQECYNSLEKIKDPLNSALAQMRIVRILVDKTADLYNLDRASLIVEDAFEKLKRVGARKDIISVLKLRAQISRQKNSHEEYAENIEEAHRLELELLSGEAQTKVSIMETSRRLELARKEQELITAQNSELEQLNQHLAQLNAEKNELLGIAAHDLKNPLAAIAMQTSLLEQNVAQQDAETTRRMLAEVRERIQGMINLITRILDVNAIEANMDGMELYRFDLAVAVKRVVEGCEPEGVRKKIDLVYESTPVVIMGDRPSLMQVAENLIGNALKYTPIGGSVEVSVRREKESAVLEVCDSGPGIPEEEIPHLFEPYSRLSTRPTGGETQTGLGLAIVKRLSQAMGGEVTYPPASGEGSRFVVSFPLPEE